MSKKKQTSEQMHIRNRTNTNMSDMFRQFSICRCCWPRILSDFNRGSSNKLSSKRPGFRANMFILESKKSISGRTGMPTLKDVVKARFSIFFFRLPTRKLVLQAFGAMCAALVALEGMNFLDAMTFQAGWQVEFPVIARIIFAQNNKSKYNIYIYSFRVFSCYVSPGVDSFQL